MDEAQTHQLLSLSLPLHTKIFSWAAKSGNSRRRRIIFLTTSWRERQAFCYRRQVWKCFFTNRYQLQDLHKQPKSQTSSCIVTYIPHYFWLWLRNHWIIYLELVEVNTVKILILHYGSPAERSFPIHFRIGIYSRATESRSMVWVQLSAQWLHCGKERKVRILILFCYMIMFKVWLVVGYNVKAHLMIYNLSIEIDIVTHIYSLLTFFFASVEKWWAVISGMDEIFLGWYIENVIIVSLQWK